MSERERPEAGEIRDIWVVNDWTVEHIPGARYSGLQWTAKVNGRSRRWGTYIVTYSPEEAAERLRAAARHYQARADRCLKAAESLLALKGLEKLV